MNCYQGIAAASSTLREQEHRQDDCVYQSGVLPPVGKYLSKEKTAIS